MARPKKLEEMVFISLKIPPGWKKRMARIREHLGITRSELMRTGTEKEMIEAEKRIKKPKA